MWCLIYIYIKSMSVVPYPEIYETSLWIVHKPLFFVTVVLFCKMFKSRSVVKIKMELALTVSYSKHFCFQYSEFLESVLTKGANIFKNFDLKLEGDFSLPRQPFELLKDKTKYFLVGGIVPMTFSKIFLSVCIAVLFSPPVLKALEPLSQFQFDQRIL